MDHHVVVPESPDDLILAFQAAKLLGIGHRVLYAMVRSGQVPAQRRSGAMVDQAVGPRRRP